MKTKIDRLGRRLFLGLVTIILMAGCAPKPGVATETALPIKATLDPLYTLHCIRQSGKSDLCYAGELLAANNELLEKAAWDFCSDKPIESGGWCFINIWKDESSVGQSVPLTEAEKASRIALFSRKSMNGAECFQTYSNGEIASSSSGCQ